MPYPYGREDASFASFEEEAEWRNMYKQRLLQYLLRQVELGFITRREVSNIVRETFALLDIKTYTFSFPGGREMPYFKHALEDIEGGGLLPYIDEISGSPIDFRQSLASMEEKIRKQAVQKVETAKTKETYMRDLEPFLNSAVSQGSIKLEQKEEIKKMVESEIDMGVSTRSLPYYDEVQEYHKAIQTYAGALQKQRAQEYGRVGDWVPPDYTPLTEEQEAAYGRMRAVQQNIHEQRLGWEQERDRVVEQMSPYTDWLQRWELEHQVSPYEVPTEAQPIYRGGMPETPGWLAQISGLTAGQPVGRTTLPTPSGQTWAQLLPSQQAMYGSLAEWQGTPMEDIIGRMRQTAPRTPYISPAWRPPRQRIGR